MGIWTNFKRGIKGEKGTSAYKETYQEALREEKEKQQAIRIEKIKERARKDARMKAQGRNPFLEGVGKNVNKFISNIPENASQRLDNPQGRKKPKQANFDMDSFMKM